MNPDTDNIQVVVRVRPLSLKEHEEDAPNFVIIDEAKPNIINVNMKPKQKPFIYDCVLDHYTSQERVFDLIGRPMADTCFQGYNSSIFAYGQTGAGKTYTVQGRTINNLNEDLSERGLQPRVFDYIFAMRQKAIEANTQTNYEVSCTYCEIYNEEIMDLLNPTRNNLSIREDVHRGVYVEGLKEVNVKGPKEAYDLLKKGAHARHTGATEMNTESSRSHSLFTITIHRMSIVENTIQVRASKLHFIDLAGSERQKRTSTGGIRLREAGNINKSLSVLGQVINSLVEVSEGKNRHIRYRDSKLTFLLKDSLSGNSKTCLIANVSPAMSASAETLSTLQFAQRAKKIRTKASVNKVMVENGDVESMKRQLDGLRREMTKNSEAMRSKGMQVDLGYQDLEKKYKKDLQISEASREEQAKKCNELELQVTELQNKEQNDAQQILHYQQKYEQTYNEYQEKILSFRTYYEQKEEIEKRLKDSLNTLGCEKEELKNALISLDTRKDIAIEELKNAMANMMRLKDELTQVHQTEERYKAEIERLHAENNEYVRAYNSTDHHIYQLETSLHAKQEECEAYKHYIANIQRELDQMNQDMALYRDKLSELQTTENQRNELDHQLEQKRRHIIEEICSRTQRLSHLDTLLENKQKQYQLLSHQQKHDLIEEPSLRDTTEESHLHNRYKQEEINRTTERDTEEENVDLRNATLMVSRYYSMENSISVGQDPFHEYPHLLQQQRILPPTEEFTSLPQLQTIQEETPKPANNNGAHHDAAVEACLFLQEEHKKVQSEFTRFSKKISNRFSLMSDQITNELAYMNLVNNPNQTKKDGVFCNPRHTVFNYKLLLKKTKNEKKEYQKEIKRLAAELEQERKKNRTRDGSGQTSPLKSPSESRHLNLLKDLKMNGVNNEVNTKEKYCMLKENIHQINDLVRKIEDKIKGEPQVSAKKPEKKRRIELLQSIENRPYPLHEEEEKEKTNKNVTPYKRSASSSGRKEALRASLGKNKENLMYLPNENLGKRSKISYEEEVNKSFKSCIFEIDEEDIENSASKKVKSN